MKKYFFGFLLIIAPFFLNPDHASASIAFGGATTFPSDIATTSISWIGPSISGSNTIGLVGVWVEKIGGTGEDLLSDITWSGNSMTLVKKQLRNDGTAGSNGWLYLYYVTNPASNAVITISSSATANITGGIATYYTGASQTGIPDATNSAAVHISNSLDTTVTTIADSSLIVGYGLSDNGGVAAGTGMTSRATQSNAFILGDSNGPKTPAGSYTIGITGTGNGNEVIVAASFAPYVTPPPPSINGSGTINRLAKFTTSTTTIGDSLFSDDGTNTTLTSGNLYLQINTLIDSVTNGVLNFGTTQANAINVGRIGIITTVPGIISFGGVTTTSNCNSSGSPSSCGSAPAGSVVLPTGGSTLVVNTTAVTANSQILVTEDSSLGSRLGVTCNTSAGRTYMVTTRTAGTSFTVQSDKNPVANGACLSYWIVN